MSALSGAARDLLELLGLAPSPPSPRAFEDLFLRFQARVPYETLSRLRRGPLEPEDLFAALVAEGGGSAGGERTRAFAALAEALGYEVRIAAGTARGLSGAGWRPHAAVLARLGPDEALADVAFPLPVLLPLTPPAEVPTGLGRVTASLEGDSLSVVVDGQGEASERVRLSLAPAAVPEDGAPAPRLLRVLDDRVLTLAGGELLVHDAWSRLAAPFDARERVDALRTLFAREELTREELEALPPPAAGPPRLTVFDRSDVPAAELRARLASPSGLLALLAPATRMEDVAESEGGWSWRLVEEPGGRVRRERVTRTANGLHVESDDPAVGARDYELEARGEGTRLTLTATLSREVPPLGLGESVRKTLVFHLVSELLALSRS